MLEGMIVSSLLALSILWFSSGLLHNWRKDLAVF